MTGEPGAETAGTAPSGRGDKHWMRRALDLAATATDIVAPNPMVGAVVLDASGQVVGEGSTVATRHAEPIALEQAGPRAEGGTIYVTLEPCRHYGNTPPCTQAVLDSGVCRVVVAQLDPDSRVGGEGVAELRRAGLDVEVGVLRVEAEGQLEAYRHHRTTGRPFVILKLALTVDGRTAAPDGTSRWITGEAARADAHRLRRASDAVLVGSGTVLADDPRLTVRLDPLPPRQPARVVLDRTGRVPPTAALFGEEGQAIVYTEAVEAARSEAWRAAGATVVVLPPGGSLRAVLEDLGQRGVLQLLVEGGPTVAGEIVRAGLYERLVVYLGAALAGGEDARPALAGPGASTIGGFARLRLEAVTRLDHDMRLDYRADA
ncbi:MAG: bifunctional diaminohydroxyphosphoribosylaminopyrimidine deaminase/5-amino-6-(5-phosphoribosylamino)uracil reductase RibD [Acidimicrobiia bacterium]|nr:bifunctional diaminohydroxyphosphoribosylaminopyrimidine deaminase/5-amino-6-(5-phosphoribosylamino)uracil reductase RibD [Acidimicrobiia bacterium]